MGSPAFFLFFFSLSPQLIVITVVIEAFYLDKLVTEKREFVLLIFFKKKIVAILNFLITAASIDQIWKMFVISRKMTSIVQKLLPEKITV